MVLTGLPSQNVLYMLLTVGELKRVEGKLKLFKLQHLLQNEGKVKFDQPDEEREMGFTAYGALDRCIYPGYIRETPVPSGLEQSRCDYELTEAGTKIYSVFKKRLPKKKLDELSKLLTKYNAMSGAELMNYTHKKYIDGFALKSVAKMSQERMESLNTICKMMGDFIKSTKDTESYVMVGKLEHVKKILETLPKKATSRVQAGTILCSTKELEENLANAGYRPNDATEELFSFIENYAEKEKMVPSLGSVDLTELSKEDQACLSKSLNQVKPRLFS